ncbi:MAG: DUF4012 domain-containing protein [Candidatus Doudnabacteria bacterium]|nr:DUF4012 domain-containing protein [Candidatus Doudnabacteria bacterium]
MGHTEAPDKLETRRTKILPEILAYLLVVLAAWAFLQSARLSAFVLQIKDKITDSSAGGVDNLEKAKGLLIRQDLTHASLELNLALESFNKSSDELKALEKNLLGLTALFPQTKSAQNLISASIDLTAAGKSALNFYELSSAFSFSQFGLVRGSAGFSDLLNELANIEEKLASASKKIQSLNMKSLPMGERGKIAENLKKISLVQNSVGNIKELLLVGQRVFSGQKRILLLFQNQNELRPTGGFIGSFAEMELLEGKIARFKISSVYDLDGQLKENIAPPWPILAVNSRWYLRDANWFSSFDESANKISEFYEKEGGETPDLVMAITPRIVGEIIKITGPLTTQDGQKLDSDNLTESLQALTQGSGKDPANEPKKVLNELFTKLFQKIGNLEPKQKNKILEALQVGFFEKQAVLYSRHKDIQKVFEAFNWAGKISQATDRDYLQISTANLGGTKTDLEIQQTLRLESNIGENGQIENHLTITRTNLMPNLPYASNKSFIRVYVPENSKLIVTQGFDANGPPLPTLAKVLKQDPDILKWEETQVKEASRQTVIGKESQKTFFGNWVTLLPGETRTIKISYQLPFRLKVLDRMSLLLQKQPGSQNDQFEYTINFPNFAPEWENFNQTSGNAKFLTVSGLLSKDRFFGIVLRKQN